MAGRPKRVFTDEDETIEDMIVNACKVVVEAKNKEDRAKAVHELDSLICDIKAVVQ